MTYRAHQNLVQPALASASLPRLISGVVLMVIAYVVMALIYENLVGQMAGDKGFIGFFQGGTPLSVIALLLEFGLLIIALAAVLNKVHKRNLPGLLGAPGLMVADFAACLKLLAPLYIFLLLLPMPDPYGLQGNLALGRWLTWLPLALPAVLIQISAEELLFRGYLQSQLAARFRHPAVWIGVPSVLFGLLHYSPALAGDNAWALVVWAALFGAAAADLTARTGTLGPALALHFINNIFAILVTAPKGDLDGLSLYTVPVDMSDSAALWTLMPIEIMFTLCAWLAARLALRV